VESSGALIFPVHANEVTDCVHRCVHVTRFDITFDQILHRVEQLGVQGAKGIEFFGFDVCLFMILLSRWKLRGAASTGRPLTIFNWIILLSMYPFSYGSFSVRIPRRSLGVISSALGWSAMSSSSEL